LGQSFQTRKNAVIKRISIITSFALLAAVALSTTAEADPGWLRHPNKRAQDYRWHANYVHSAYGQPVALVVPPTAQLQTNWSWGAPSARFSRIDHQFGRDNPGQGPFRGGFRRTPVWPRDTAQFGVHYVRGPWYPIQP
jgi:hypothetical protein